MNKQPGIFRASTLVITLLTASSTLLAPLPAIVSADNGADTTTATQTTKNTVNYDELNNTISQLNLSKAQKAAGLNVSKYAVSDFTTGFIADLAAQDIKRLTIDVTANDKDTLAKAKQLLTVSKDTAVKINVNFTFDLSDQAASLADQIQAYWNGVGNADNYADSFTIANPVRKTANGYAFLGYTDSSMIYQAANDLQGTSDVLWSIKTDTTKTKIGLTFANSVTGDDIKWSADKLSALNKIVSFATFTDAQEADLDNDQQQFNQVFTNSTAGYVTAVALPLVALSSDDSQAASSTDDSEDADTNTLKLNDISKATLSGAQVTVPKGATNNDLTSFVGNLAKITGASATKTITGVDLTKYASPTYSGGPKTGIYENTQGQKVADIFAALKANGINTITVKTANTTTAEGLGDLQDALKVIKQASAAGLKTNLVLTYSKDVDNPQTATAGWTKAADITNYTKYVLAQLDTTNVKPDIITVGSESDGVIPLNFSNDAADNWWQGVKSTAQQAALIKQAGYKVGLGLANATATKAGSGDTLEKLFWAFKATDITFNDVDYIFQSVWGDQPTASLEKTKQFTKAQVVYTDAKVANTLTSDDTKTTLVSQAADLYNLLGLSVASNNAGGVVLDANSIIVNGWSSLFKRDGDSYLTGNAKTTAVAAVFGKAVGLAVNTKDTDTNATGYVTGADTDLAKQKVIIKKIKNMTDSSIQGMDISSYQALKDAGVTFRNAAGKKESLIKILHENGVNYIRLRIWNDPKDANSHYYGGGNNDAAQSLKIAKEASAAGMKILVDFQYSDFWADPAKQPLPKAWVKYADNPVKLAQMVKQYTTDTLSAFKKSGIKVGMVQVGNEITSGAFGIINSRDTSGTNIAVWGDKAASTQIDKYLTAGIKAVRTVYPQALVALHLETPDVNRYESIMKAWQRDKVDYDVLGSSYYPFWGTNNSVTNLRAIQNLAAKYGKLFAVLETAWTATNYDSDGTDNNISDFNNVTGLYDVSPQGQVDALSAVYSTVMNNENNNGLGAFYWEPAWIAVHAGQENAALNNAASNQFGTGWASQYADSYEWVGTWGGSSWDNQALFDANGQALQSLSFYTAAVTNKTVQTTIIKQVDQNGQEIGQRRFFFTQVGKTQDIALARISGYTRANYTYNIKANTSGVKTLTFHYAPAQVNTLKFVNRKTKQVVKKQVKYTVVVGKTKKIKLPKIKGYHRSNYTYTIKATKGGNKTHTFNYVQNPVKKVQVNTLKFVNRKTKRVVKRAVKYTVTVGKTKKVKLPKIKGYQRSNYTYTINATKGGNKTHTFNYVKK
ncbi:glycosyl hydrolase 53 family protein [Periweissella beninensis]|uniref:glycosyl hydrolase 53 family protein n=1 Tax=Periweissella beninensis TaxID=504936 RepID=UPI0021A4F0BA|nr:glycosyl hydrolase 53 family protein [Periweissella beninensis]MCT4396034.1 hypothetical protein [Periweissella beninensis]